MSRKSRGGLSRGEHKLFLALEKVTRLTDRLQLAQAHYEVLKDKITCTHPESFKVGEGIDEHCNLCGWHFNPPF